MKEMVEKFQCPGCIYGSNTECGKYNYNESYFRCINHYLGTQLGLGNTIALGLPKGFNKPGLNEDGNARYRMDIRLFKKGSYFGWDKLNIPVWATEQDGYLFVRTFAPWINCSWVDVIECGTLDMCPNALDVSQFINEID